MADWTCPNWKSHRSNSQRLEGQRPFNPTFSAMHDMILSSVLTAAKLVIRRTYNNNVGSYSILVMIHDIQIFFKSYLCLFSPSCSVVALRKAVNLSHRSNWFVSEWMLESGWLRARSCFGTVSSLTDVWDREPAHGSKSAEHRPARRSCCLPPPFEVHTTAKILSPLRCTQPAEPVSPGMFIWWRRRLVNGGGAQCVLLETGAPRRGSGRQMAMMGQVNLAQINHHTHQTTNHPILSNYGHLFLHTSICWSEFWK